jgi:hypothetical protein
MTKTVHAAIPRGSGDSRPFRDKLLHCYRFLWMEIIISVTKIQSVKKKRTSYSTKVKPPVAKNEPADERAPFNT